MINYYTVAQSVKIRIVYYLFHNMWKFRLGLILRITTFVQRFRAGVRSFPRGKTHTPPPHPPPNRPLFPPVIIITNDNNNGNGGGGAAKVENLWHFDRTVRVRDKFAAAAHISSGYRRTNLYANFTSGIGYDPSIRWVNMAEKWR